MAYITNADIEERLGSATYVQLADDDGDDVADVGVVDEARLGAEGEVSSYLGRRFQLPIDLGVHTDLVDVLASITLDLAEYRLRLRRPPVSQAIIDRHRKALDWLGGVAGGTIALPAALPVARSQGTVAETFGAERTLSREELSDF